MKKLILMAVVSVAFAACGSSAPAANTTPDNAGGDTAGDTGGDAYGDMDEGGM